MQEKIKDIYGLGGQIKRKAYKLPFKPLDPDNIFIVPIEAYKGFKDYKEDNYHGFIIGAWLALIIILLVF